MRITIKIALGFVAVAGAILLYGLVHSVRQLAPVVPVPNARLLIKLERPIPDVELFELLDETAKAQGYPLYVSRGLAAHRAAATKVVDHRFMHKWYVVDSDHPSDAIRNYHIAFGWDHSYESVTEIEFIFYNAGTDPFGEQEWMMFSDWMYRHIPTIFPGSVVTIRRHPARFTQPENIARFSEASGIPLPQRDQAGDKELDSRAKLHGIALTGVTRLLTNLCLA